MPMFWLPASSQFLIPNLGPAGWGKVFILILGVSIQRLREVFCLGQWTVTDWNIIIHSLCHFPKLTLHQASANQELHLQAQNPDGIMCIMTVPDFELRTRWAWIRSKWGAVLIVWQVAGVADGVAMGAGSSIWVAWLASEGRGTGEGGWPCVREFGLLVQVRSAESTLPPFPGLMKAGPVSPLLPVGQGIQHCAQHEECLMNEQLVNEWMKNWMHEWAMSSPWIKVCPEV